MNQDVKDAIREAGIRQWRIAKKIGVSEFTLVRWLRDELPEDKKNMILWAIEKLSRGEEG